MLNLRKTVGLIGIAAAMSACSWAGTGSVNQATGDNAIIKDSETRAKGATGGTSDGAGGAIGTTTPATVPAEKEQRGNAPPGVDRDGHGPAAGAIVDPTGAATRSKPY